MDVGDDCIGCDKCTVWYHPTSTCVGLPDNVIKTIRDYGGRGVSFCCTACRLDDSGDSSGDNTAASLPGGSQDLADREAVKQLFETVKGLCFSVGELTKNVQQLLQSTSQLQPTSASSVPPDDLRVTIREEVREMEERDKRKDSIVVKGLDVPDGRSFQDVFQEVGKCVLGSEASFNLVDVVCISREKKLYRAKIQNTEQRKNLLTNAKELKDSRYNYVFINRDLTKAQRNELFKRREQYRQQRASDSSQSASASAVALDASASAGSGRGGSARGGSGRGASARGASALNHQ